MGSRPSAKPEESDEDPSDDEDHGTDEEGGDETEDGDEEEDDDEEGSSLPSPSTTWSGIGTPKGGHVTSTPRREDDFPQEERAERAPIPPVRRVPPPRPQADKPRPPIPPRRSTRPRKAVVRFSPD